MTGEYGSTGRYHEQVVGALLATSIVSPTRFSWYGSPSVGLARAVTNELTPDTARAHLLATLTSHLYTNLYCPGVARPSTLGTVSRSMAFDSSSFVTALSDANEGAGGWQDGWSVTQISDNEVTVTRDGLEMRVPRGDGWVHGIGSTDATEPLRVRFLKEMFGWSPGFYVATSNAPFAVLPISRTARLYWNLRPSGAAPLVRSVTRLLNGAELRFSLKVLNHPARFNRCDAAVLYLHREDVGGVSSLIEAIYSEVRTHLKYLTPAFTRPLAAGVGYADDPGGGQSFGTHRCHLLADGMIRAHEKGATTVSDRFECVHACFLDEAIHLESPFTSGDLADPVEIQLPRAAHPVIGARTGGARSADCKGLKFLDASHQIGRRIAQQATWHRGRCNWLGAIMGETAPSDPAPDKSSASLGPELYSGCSGIALFLAELARATGDRDLRVTAVGAINQALTRSSAIPASSRWGLYTGWIGVALAGVRVGHLVDNDLLVERSTRLLRRATRGFPSELGFDVISGRSGAIVGLLALGNMLADDSLLDCAAELGDALIDSAEVTDRGWSWKTSPLSSTMRLTGLSHGAAGAGWALLELARATGDGRYRTAGEAAFRYERSLYDEGARNWPDFRTATSVPRSRQRLVFSSTWCHGAPGIALSRLRGYEVFHDETMQNEAHVALTTTHDVVADELRSGIANYSLCHGLAGNAEVLSYGCDVLGAGRPADAGLVAEVARVGIEAYGGSADQWPCGTRGAETPDLMLGLAGIGYFYLRLHDRRVPSLLLLRPERFSHNDSSGSPH